MNAVVIVAAGRGTRMGPNIDKLFLEIAGRPVVVHAWERFQRHPEIDAIILVVRDGMKAAFEELAESFGLLAKPVIYAVGGKERQDSVWNGIRAVPEDARLVAIHDGARPCPSAKLISDTLAAAAASGAAVAAQRVTDTIKSSADGQSIAEHLDRSRLWSVQTPQTFRVEVIRRALQAVAERGLTVTDDTAACECIGQSVRLVESNAPNPKVTTPADLPLIEALLRSGICA